MKAAASSTSKVDSSEQAEKVEFDERQAADEADSVLGWDQPGEKKDFVATRYERDRTAFTDFTDSEKP